MNTRKTIRVVAAVIRDGDRVFATQRGYGPYKDGWEFPGGKIEPGETPEQALDFIREQLAEREHYYLQAHHVIDVNRMDNFEKIATCIEEIRQKLKL